MINLLDLKWLLRCQQQLKELADDPHYAGMIIQHLDEDPDLREALSHLYVRALKTLESMHDK